MSLFVGFFLQTFRDLSRKTACRKCKTKLSLFLLNEVKKGTRIFLMNSEPFGGKRLLPEFLWRNFKSINVFVAQVSWLCTRMVLFIFLLL